MEKKPYKRTAAFDAHARSILHLRKEYSIPDAVALIKQLRAEGETERLTSVLSISLFKLSPEQIEKIADRVVQWLEIQYTTPRENVS